MRRIWGIYKGYNPRTNPEQQWRKPLCPTCSSELLPWIDWQSFGCVGYCPACSELMYVYSVWEPVPGTRLREERSRLTRHEVRSLGLQSAGFLDAFLLWEWHESIPVSEQIVREADALRRAHRGGSESQVVLEHLIWTLIWNASGSTPDLLADHLRFTFEHPHYVTFQSRPVWIGDELDLALELERRYGGLVLHLVHEIYEEAQVEPLEFKKRLGLYFPFSAEAYEHYEPEFVEYAKKARRRIT
jgi:hypothetical protein